MPAPFNVDAFKVGGIRFIKIGRFNIAVSVSRRYRRPARSAPVIIDLEPVRVDSVNGSTLRFADPLPKAEPAPTPFLQRDSTTNALVMLLGALAILPAAVAFASFLAGRIPGTAEIRAPTACELAAVAATDANLEACFGLPVELPAMPPRN